MLLRGIRRKRAVTGVSAGPGSPTHTPVSLPSCPSPDLTSPVCRGAGGRTAPRVGLCSGAGVSACPPRPAWLQAAPAPYGTKGRKKKLPCLHHSQAAPRKIRGARNATLPLAQCKEQNDCMKITLGPATETSLGKLNSPASTAAEDGNFTQGDTPVEKTMV